MDFVSERQILQSCSTQDNKLESPPYHLNSHETELRVLRAVRKLPTNHVGAAGLATTSDIELRLPIDIVDTNTCTRASESELKAKWGCTEPLTGKNRFRSARSSSGWCCRAACEAPS